jgi:hypothetical protein
VEILHVVENARTAAKFFRDVECETLCARIDWDFAISR